MDRTMKRISYQMMADGVLRPYYMISPDDALSDNVAAAKKFAYNGEVTVEDIEDPITEHEPTTDERVASLEEQLAESDAVALALYEAQVAQESVIAEHDEAILGIYEMIGG